MFEYLRGKVAHKEPNVLVIDVAGVGYLLEIPSSTFAQIIDIGAEYKVLTHFHVREDTQKLYGFATEGERDTFRKLISISQIGPKVALSVLSNISVRDLAYAVAGGDSARLKSIPGIGPKTAQRLVVELKDKLTFDTSKVSKQSTDDKISDGGLQVTDRDAFSAMIALGYSEVQVMRAMARVKETIGAHASVEEWIRLALQVI